MALQDIPDFVEFLRDIDENLLSELFDDCDWSDVEGRREERHSRESEIEIIEDPDQTATHNYMFIVVLQPYHTG